MVKWSRQNEEKLSGLFLFSTDSASRGKLIFHDISVRILHRQCGHKHDTELYKQS